MKGCTISELLGLSLHPDNISNNELNWWMARSCMKPLPAVRLEIIASDQLYISSINAMSGKSAISHNESKRNWFKGTDEEEWGEAKKLVEKLQKELDEKKKKENGENS